jgi:TP53 regulating kinase-like protein
MEVLERQLKAITKSIPITPVSQGAEALIYSTDVHPFFDSPSSKLIIKYRPPKPYRHAKLDAQLTKHRTLSEARLLQRLLLSNINAPKLVFVDPKNGLIWMEYVVGLSLKQWIWNNEQILVPEQVRSILLAVGNEIGKLHISDIVHGDLTSSNIMLRNDSLEPVLIDFGLGSHSSLAEDKAVDLYVLERAISSTHPVNSQQYNEWLLEGYLQPSNSDRKARVKTTEVLRRLEDVRMRGRKRSMVG